MTPASICQTVLGYKVSIFKNYEYCNEYKNNLLAIENSFPNAQIIAFICPIHNSLIGLEQTYPHAHVRWLQDIEEVFGHVYNFKDNGQLTSNPVNFFDGAHFYPFIGDIIISELSKKFLPFSPKKP